MLQTRITTSSAGISFYNPGALYSIHSTWENIEQARFIELRGFGQVLCLVLKKGVDLGWRASLDWGTPKQERGRIIPIANAYFWGRLNDLKNDIRTFCPGIKGLK